MKNKRNSLMYHLRIIFTFNALMLLFTFQLFGQIDPGYYRINYCKPNGTLARDATIVEEMSQNEINTITADFKFYYPLYDVLAPASSRYNCFGYAFCMTEGSDTVSLGHIGNASIVNRFTRDNSSVGYSFIEVNENQNPDKAILIENGCNSTNPLGDTISTHAAIVYNNDTLISKSGFFPVFKHPKNGNLPIVLGLFEEEVGTDHCYKYYKRNYTISLNGPNLVNGDTTFSVALTRTTFSQITWQVEPAGLFQSATGSGQTANLQIKNNPTHLADSGSITFYMGHGCDNTYRVTKRFAIQIPACTVNSNTAYSEGFTVKPGATVTVTGKINNKENSSIKVPASGKLLISGGILTNTVSGKMWQGITVSGTSNQQQTAQYQGTVELKNGAVIEHALCAISTVDSTGGIIKATNATFRNNLQAINYRPYERINSGMIADNVGKFTNCTFIIDTANRFSANGKSFRYHV